MSKKIIIGITGSIAAFKTIQFISDLVKKDYIVEVLLTEAATHFVTKTSIEALTKRKVYCDVFDDDPGCITHVDIVKDADVFMVVPASATTIAKLANGIADNMLSAAYLAATCPKVVAPAMNVHMYGNVVTQRNLRQLVNDGALLVEPGVGLLACGDVGKGKLASYDELFLALDYALHNHPLLHKKVLVTAGPTQESLDPVRYLTNHSSGKMGYAIARAAYTLGADVTLITGETNLSLPFVNTIHITSALDLYKVLDKEFDDCDYLIMAAAVGDYRFETISDQKIKKHDDSLELKLIKNPDILKHLGSKKDKQVLCGFAMETQDLIKNAKEKCISKNCDLLIANNLRDEGAGFKTDTNKVTIFTKDTIEEVELMSKNDLSYLILDKCMEVG